MTRLENEKMIEGSSDTSSTMINFNRGTRVRRRTKFASFTVIVVMATATFRRNSSLVYQPIDFIVEGVDLEYGYPSEEHLPLWAWEKESIGFNSQSPPICNPPKGIPSSCCLGAISSGVSSTWSDLRCLNADHERTEPWTKEYMKRMPFESGRPCDVCEIAYLLAELNWTLALQGDSVMNQVWEGLVCEFMRRGFPVSVDVEEFQSTKENNSSNWVYHFSRQEP